ncbi:MAG: ATPase, partial [Corynebacterium sp.]|nr:ATPase [Corynebacterium sp.]
TVSVLEVDELAAAVGGDPDVTSVLLQATDATAKYRLERREHGDSLREHIERSTKAASFLEKKAAPSVHRIPTGGRTPEEIALVLADLAGWEAS